jgi:excisionase family DNA binding protein
VDEREEVVADDKLLLRIEEAAQRLGIGRSLMYRLVLSGQVQSVPLGRLRRILAEALREYFERLRVEASGKSPAA